MSPEDGRREREARSLALERAYVHDVYDQISTHFSNTRYRAWPRVKHFLQGLEPGSLVADIGCGNGKYLQIGNQVFSVGVDRCTNLVNTARQKGNELMVSDNLCLPFREESFDACLSIAVIHHFATTERRVSALRELTRILRIGGRLMITVWAMEQRHRKFESQDVLVPWHRPEVSSSDDKTSSIDRDPNSTTTDEDDVLHYHACHQTDETSSSNRSSRKSAKRRNRSRLTSSSGSANDGDGKETTGVIDDGEDDEDDEDDCCSLHCGRYSEARCDSEASSPKESCYSFVRRALQVAPPDTTETQEQKLTSGRRASTGRSWGFAGGEDLGSPLSDGGRRKRMRHPFTHGGSLDSQENLDDVPIELRHLEPDDPNLLHIPPSAPTHSFRIGMTPSPTREMKSRSLSDLVKAHPPSPSSSIGSRAQYISCDTDVSDVIRSKSSSSCLSLSSRTNASSPISASGISGISGDSTKGIDSNSRSGDSGVDEETARLGRRRPTLRKQKASIQETDVEPSIVIEISKADRMIDDQKELTSPAPISEDEKKDYLSLPKLGIIKQSSLNDEYIYLDRFMENERLKQSIQKQSSLNDDLIYGNKEEVDEPLRERLFKSQYKHFQVLKESFQRLRTASLDRFDFDTSESLKNGIVKLLQSWKSEILLARTSKADSSSESCSAENNFAKTFSQRTPISKLISETKSKAQSLYLKKSFGEDVNNSEQKTNTDENKLACRDFNERKPSREESSDSSKENSFQSDTSLDSEDSCVSVIFVPRPGQGGISLSDKERNRSISSESSEGSDKPNSPKSPKSPKSPGGGRYFSCGKFLGTKASNKVPPIGNSSSAEPRRITPPTEGASESRRFSPPNSSVDVSSSTKISITLPPTSESETASLVSLSTDNKIAAAESKVSQCSLHVIPESKDELPSLKKSINNPENYLGRYQTTSTTYTTTTATTAMSMASTTLRTRTSSISGSEVASPRMFPYKTTSTISNRALRYSHQIPEVPTLPKSVLQALASPKFSSHEHIPTRLTSSSNSFTTSSFRDTMASSNLNVVRREKDISDPSKRSPLLGDAIEINRTAGKHSSSRNVQVARKSVPRFLTFEVFNPETDDLDSDSSPSSSPHSGSSVIERGWPTEKEIEELDREIKRKEEEERLKSSSGIVSPTEDLDDTEELPKISLVEPVHRMDTINEEAQNSDNSRENSPKEKEFPQSTIRKSSSPMSHLRSMAHCPLESSLVGSKLPQYPSSSYSPGHSTSTMQEKLSSGKAHTPFYSSILSQQSSPVRGKPYYSSSFGEEAKNIGYPYSLTNASLCASFSPRQSYRFSKASSFDGSAKASSSSVLDQFPNYSSSSVFQDEYIHSETGLSSHPSLDSSYAKDHHSSQNLMLLQTPAVTSQSLATAESKRNEPLTEKSLLTESHSDDVKWRQRKEGYGSMLNSSHTQVSPKRKLLVAPQDHKNMKPTFQEKKDQTTVKKEYIEEGGSNQKQSEKLEAVSPEPCLTVIGDVNQTSINKRPYESKSTPFELPSFIQSFLGGATTVGISLRETRHPSLDTVQTSLKLSKALLQKSPSRKYSFKSKTKDADAANLNRSESSLPLICPEESETPVLPAISDSDENNPPERKKLHLPSPELKKKLSPKSSNTKRDCRHCRREEEKRKFRKQEKEMGGIQKGDLGRAAKARRDCLRPQGSLDSAQDKERESPSKRWAELSRSSSLDLETSRSRGSITRDGSLSTSQDSLQSDMGGAPTLHRYYHVFKEGELDQLIEKYVHNLHIISSYYDHANWCIVAEKVQVWTI